MKLYFPLKKKNQKHTAQVSERDPDTRNRLARFRLRCNLCGKAFKAGSRLFRFCKACKSEDELFLFAQTFRSNPSNRT